jgi:hypothetical protein
MSTTSRGGRAVALVFALVALALAASLGAVLTATVLQSLRLSRDLARRDELVNLAESGAQLALWHLARDEADAIPPTAKVPGGSCTLAVARQGAAAWRVVSRAARGPHACTVTVRARRAGGHGAEGVRVLELRFAHKIPPRRWVHYLPATHGRVARTYVEGRADKVVLMPGGLETCGRALSIGRGGVGSWSHGFVGIVDDVLVWDRALAEVEVLGLWASLSRGR